MPPRQLSGKDLSALADPEAGYAIPRAEDQPAVVAQSRKFGEGKDGQIALMELAGVTATPRGTVRGTSSQKLQAHNNKSHPQSVGFINMNPIICGDEFEDIPQTLEESIQHKTTALAAPDAPRTLEESMGLKEDEGFDAFNGEPPADNGIPASERLKAIRSEFPKVTTTMTPSGVMPGVQTHKANDPAIEQMHAAQQETEQGTQHLYAGQAVSQLDAFFTQRASVQMITNDGVLIIPVIHAEATPYCVSLIIRVGEDAGMTFIPKLGSKLKIVLDNKEYPCYFPGTYVIYDNQNFAIMMFMIRSDDDDNGKEKRSGEESDTGSEGSEEGAP